MKVRRMVWVVAAVVVVAAALLVTAIPRFASTRERAAGEWSDGGADKAQEWREPAITRAVVSQEAAPAGGAASPLRLPSVSQLLAEVPADTNRLLVRTGDMAIEVDSLEPAIASLAQVVRAVGGFLANTSTLTNDAQRSATIEVKIPAARFEAAVERLRALGDIQSVNVAVEDVGEEYTDVAARMANAQRLEARLLGLLTSRTGGLQDVLQVERELARVREEIERFQGRLQYLRQRAAFSTLTVRLYEPGTIVGSQPGLGAVGDAFKQAWRNFIWFVVFLVEALGVIVPLGALAVGGWLAWKRWRPSGT